MHPHSGPVLSPTGPVLECVVSSAPNNSATCLTGVSRVIEAAVIAMHGADTGGIALGCGPGA